ncbi:phage tail tape measure protein [Phytobacter diazotrophicus]|jgi:lambda family phage tail tape measure protein|uniref:Phage tail tape measure protein n=1 Tax=Phytobacter diazotrophicus TaxID=395631 RepID=A0ABM7VXT5_9ENTR|nr:MULTISPECIES: phage tail tape measure protein [Phytobacter]MDU4994993.1 phage tail tape measure protein [Enterobacteriaceae bacterium]QIH64284.1 phage tail tape measure protein [Enterobacteriaceae bacterium A-F18]MDU7134248.1 phage tail tape measure protein [Enterobacteriaceae bacterium]BBE78700.1 phage tail tape measure protein [Phytobacter sp. MRY16-398]BDD52076.1 phage tail tape measure protein [Phytobacter diazotrophicus]
MATLRELIIKVSADSGSFQREIARASRMGQDYYKTMEQGGKQAAAVTRETQRSIAALNAELVSVKSTATGLAGAFAGAFATHQLIQYADTWNQLSGRLRLASTGAEDFAAAQRSLMAISQRTGTSFEANATLYARIASSLRDAGYASADVAKVTETVATSLKLSGASTEEASSVITQLSQALGSGVLRGEEFNAIMENGGRLAKLLADGMKTTVGGLRNMAQNGQLTTDKIVPLLTNVELLRKEFETLPASISGSAQKVQNSFMAWVGGANDALGASTALAGALDSLASNLDTVASGAAVLAAAGGSRLLGGILSGVTSSAGKVLDARKEQIALADAQAYAATQAQRKALANAGAATSAYNLAVAEANVAKGSNASVLAADNVIKKRSEMIAANAELVLSNRAVTASQEALNRATSAVGLLRSGASGLLSLVGGIPGALLLGAGAWYTMYQQQEQARQSAQDYAQQIDLIRQKTTSMSLGDADSNRGKTVDALVEQNRLIDEQAGKVTALKTQIDDLNSARNKPGITSENDANIVKSLGILTDQLTVEENKLNQMRERSRTIQQALNDIDVRRNDLIREQAWRQNEAYQSLIRMNGEHSEFNRLLSLGNTLLSARNGLVQVPLALPQAPVSDKDAKALLNKQRQAELAGLTGIAKVNRQVDFDLQDMGRDGPNNSTFASQYRAAAEKDYNNTQNVAAAQKAKADATREAEKADRAAASQAEQYSRKMADLSVAIEVQKVRATDGEKAADLYAAANQAGTKWTDEQRKAIRESSAELARWTQRAEENVKKQRDQAEALKQLTEAARKFKDEATAATDTAGLSDRQRQRFDETQQVERQFDKTDKGTAAVAARSAALTELDNKYRAIAESEADWRNGVSRGYENWLQNTMDIAGTVSQGVTTTMDSAMDNVASMLVRGKADWRSWGLSALEMISKVALQMAVVSAMSKSSGTSGLLGSLIGGITGLIGGGGTSSVMSSTSGTVVTGQSFSVPTPHLANALGGVYDSPSLSAYSNGVYSTPKTFAFAKGAGIFGEAGPEAIMPLTRAADGSLGVRAVNSGVNNVQTASGSPQVYITIEGNGNTSVQTDGGMTEQFGKEIGSYVERRYRELMARDISPGGAVWNLAKGGR